MFAPAQFIVTKLSSYPSLTSSGYMKILISKSKGVSASITENALFY